MRWILFTGTWRLTNSQVEQDVRASVRGVLARGDGIVTGGATGVDYFAMDEAMQIDPAASQLQVIIPTDLKSYIYDYYTNWCMEPVTKESIALLEKLLERIKQASPKALLEMPYKSITQYHYDLRNDEEIRHSDAVYAFQVNSSSGTQDTIVKSIKAGLPIELHQKYSM